MEYQGEPQKGVVQTVTESTTSTALTYVLLGFSLAAALGWTNWVKHLISTYVKVPGSAGMYLFLYAVVVTILAVIVYDLIRRYVDRNVRRVPIVGVVG